MYFLPEMDMLAMALLEKDTYRLFAALRMSPNIRIMRHTSGWYTVPVTVMSGVVWPSAPVRSQSAMSSIQRSWATVSGVEAGQRMP